MATLQITIENTLSCVWVGTVLLPLYPWIRGWND